MRLQCSQPERASEYMGKLGWFKFYPGDWMKDPELRSVSSGARGLWIDILNLMFESVRRGHLSLKNGNVVTAELLAHMTGNSTDDVTRWLQELEYSGVFSRTDTGVIYSRRMVRDEVERERIRKAVTKLRCNGDVTNSVTDSPVSVSDLVFEVDVGPKEKEPDKSMTRSLKFALPSLGEIQAYCQERNNRVDAQQWFDHYTSNGWKVGRNLMRDWRASVRTWERSSINSGGGNERPKTAAAIRNEDNAERIERAFRKAGVT